MMNLKNFLALIVLIGILIVGYQALFTEASRIRGTVKACVHSLERLNPSLDCLCEDFVEIDYTKKDALSDWNKYRQEFEKISIRYVLYDIEHRGAWASARIKVRATCRIKGKTYLLAGTPMGYETGYLSLRKRDRKWCIRRLDLPSLRDWIGRR